MNPRALQYGAGCRVELLNVHNQGGPHLSLAFAQRVAYEAGKFISDVHGHDKAATILQDIADSVALNAPLPSIDHLLAGARLAAPKPPVAWRARAWLLLRVLGPAILFGIGIGMLVARL